MNAESAGLALRVVKGRHRGALTSLATSDILLIGSHEDCDVILADPGVAAHHCGIARQAASVTLRAIEGDLVLNRRQYGPGTTVQLSAGAVVGLGEAMLEVVATVADAYAPRKPQELLPLSLVRRFRWTIGAMLAFVVVVACALNPDSLGIRTKSIAGPAEMPARAAEPAGTAVAHDVAEVLRLSGIASEARYTGNGTVTVSGHLGDPAELSSIVQSRAMRDVAGLKRVAVLNLDNGKPAPETAGTRIVSVANGAVPYAVAADGSRYYVGASLPDGGKLSGVMTSETGSAEVLIQRDGRIEHLKLARAGSAGAGPHRNRKEN
jgi:hypothetical protein